MSEVLRAVNRLEQAGGAEIETVVVLGPSHVVRWEHAVKCGAIPAPFPNTVFVGGGGLPVWSAQLFAKAKTLSASADKLLLIVADFRFGNSVFGVSPLPDSLFIDGHRNVSRDYLNGSADEFLLAKCIAALDMWRKTFGEKLIVIHWTGLTRRNEDILRGKHLENGVYRHPTWNFDELGSEDISSLAKAPLDVIRALYVDDNLHPSALGFRYLQQRINLKRPVDALRDSIHWIKDEVASSLAVEIPEPILFTGDSTWVKSTVRLLHGKPLESLAQRGVYIKPMTFDEISAFKREHRIRRVVFVTDHGEHKESGSASRLSLITKRLLENDEQTKACIFPWAAIAREIVSRRHPDLLHLAAPNPAELSSWLQLMHVEQCVEKAADFNKNVDLGEELIPTLEGIRFLLSRYG